MITEAVLKFIISALSIFINPLMQKVFNADLSKGSFSVPAPLWDYVNYLIQGMVPILPLVIAYWAWRQIKA